MIVLISALSNLIEKLPVIEQKTTGQPTEAGDCGTVFTTRYVGLQNEGENAQVPFLSTKVASLARRLFSSLQVLNMASDNSKR